MALESTPDGVAKKEKEMVIYGKIVNFEQLKAAGRIVDQVQYELKISKTDKNAAAGSMRVRQETENDEVKYIHCIKNKLEDGSSIETETEATESMFKQFKYMCESGMSKTRFEFPIEGSECKWEVDVFKSVDGTMFEWVKIDLEDWEGELPKLPIELTDVISNPYGARTEEEEAQVRMLYDTVFRTPNPVLAKS